LLYRGGDCDDLSILFCSMLEALGIESAFVTVPGHIYIAFDIGLEDGFAWGMGNIEPIRHSGKNWLPVEITVPGRGFAEAVRIGARQWQTAGGSTPGSEAAIYPMRENWLYYPPVSVNAAGDNMPAMPERAAIAAAINAELRKVTGDTVQYRPAAARK
jgi:hypothetical protein